jgi:hypothetical protein
MRGRPHQFRSLLLLLTVPAIMPTWRVFEKREEDLFRLHRERIFELGVPLARIREALQKHLGVALLEGLLTCGFA